MSSNFIIACFFGAMGFFIPFAIKLQDINEEVSNINKKIKQLNIDKEN
ncbi:hypothetical protein SYNTR_0694 [Candidatus Syntrophocurvum alkaliphilum]|uniref:Uncharacterized protein n=1 Tax=Candidatus Syntrophocurvum alkaliphilum TaxID=2293317 RepID=A0A6I6DDK5_9FIRM|nr:hypothetical protein [Candidatus Syntrophocurvum alkaliphilum]QGT99287.1 hypothetical protein SYNTR_0694 [Candidatus Syntrophocurvum alkaliphilum]